jgi:hypothetical protein
MLALLTQNSMALVKKIIIINCLLICQLGSVCQEDSTWWKRLFKKESVEEIEEGKTEDTPVIEEKVTDISAIDPKDSVDEHINLRPGSVTIHTSSALDSLNLAMTENPPAISGYRIQVYHGNLRTAKEERAKFISVDKESPCYLVSLSPNFAVRIGDYRTELDAHRDIEKIRAKYPKAYVVPDDIEPPKVSGQ